MSTLGELIDALEQAYPPLLAESWDAVGLVCGVRASTVNRVLICVDLVEETLEEARELGAELIVAHHPLLLRGVHGVPADEPKGALVHTMISEGIALYCAHTNADSANPGVSDALAAALGLVVSGPLSPGPELDTGIGRVGSLPTPLRFTDFVQLVTDALPATAWGVRAAGDPDRMISTVAVSGGAGDSYLGLAAARRVDAYVTADLRHHPASEHIAVPGNPALVDVAHWASEWPWCAQAAGVLRAGHGSLEVHVSERRTDPWTMHGIPEAR